MMVKEKSVLGKHYRDLLSVIGKGLIIEDCDIEKYIDSFKKHPKIKYRFIPLKGEYSTYVTPLKFSTGLYEITYTTKKGKECIFGMKLFNLGLLNRELLVSVKWGELTAFNEMISELRKFTLILQEKQGSRLKTKQKASKRGLKIHCIGGMNETLSLKPQQLIIDPNFKEDLWKATFSVYDNKKVYEKLKIAPFKKILLSGSPGTGKTITCQHLAKDAIEKGVFVVYVSGQGTPNPFTGGLVSGGDFDNIIKAIGVINNYKLPTLLIVEEFDTYLHNPNDKNKILNFLDGFETPFKTIPVSLIMTTNNPEAIDPRIINRRGRINRVFEYKEISKPEIAKEMAEYYFDGLPEKKHYKCFLGLTGDLVKELAVETRIRHADGGGVDDFPEFVKEFTKNLTKDERKIGGYE